MTKHQLKSLGGVRFTVHLPKIAVPLDYEWKAGVGAGENAWGELGLWLKLRFGKIIFGVGIKILKI